VGAGRGKAGQDSKRGGTGMVGGDGMYGSVESDAEWVGGLGHNQWNKNRNSLPSCSNMRTA
jgi:hypothetical protein